jgi:hypothetical protein
MFFVGLFMFILGRLTAPIEPVGRKLKVAVTHKPFITIQKEPLLQLAVKRPESAGDSQLM